MHTFEFDELIVTQASPSCLRHGQRTLEIKVL
jgi:hypothetical protein